MEVRSEEGVVAVESAERREFHVELDGNPDAGQVTFVRQIHFVEGMTEAELLEIGRFQFKILKYFVETQPRHIFSEGVCGELSRDDFVVPGLEHPGDIEEFLADPQPDQLVQLALYGSSLVYFKLDPDVQIHRTISNCATEDEVHRRIATTDDDVMRDKLIMDVREKFAAHQIQQYLSDNPGADVVLLYGAAHQFWDDFTLDDGTQPKLVSVGFSE